MALILYEEQAELLKKRKESMKKKIEIQKDLEKLQKYIDSVPDEQILGLSDDQVKRICAKYAKQSNLLQIQEENSGSTPKQKNIFVGSQNLNEKADSALETKINQKNQEENYEKEQDSESYEDISSINFDEQQWELDIQKA
ncbi:hypothetical protein PPERSA_08562 [Pseudocohnilembus persalinus]|uniref:Uncharacterized protein n=1 Tax=Pseudocohnilembus persalinus TaxID=266149 RepID=A0A0V0R6M6_PSEPJ|nr:hypothetical protein PPERSA_08562 [Pseudocohnilembus persalinus]|eukprot:KRX10159.1 hypothetical protein PPERSA_08562 [Pseudocohnilembus persalinus]